MIIHEYAYPHGRYPITYHETVLDGSRRLPKCLIVLQKDKVFGIERTSKLDGTNVYEAQSGLEDIYAYARIISDGPGDYKVWVGGNVTDNLNQLTFTIIKEDSEEDKSKEKKKYAGAALLIPPIYRTTNSSVLQPPMGDNILTGAWHITKQRLKSILSPSSETPPAIVWPQITSMVGEIIQTFTRSGLVTIQQGLVLGVTGTLVYKASCKGTEAKGFVPSWTTCQDVVVIPPTYAYMVNVQPSVAGMIAYNILPREVQSASGVTLSQSYIWVPRICLYSYKVPINIAATSGGFVFSSCVWTWESYCSGSPYVAGALSDYFDAHVFYIVDDGIFVTASKVMNINEESDDEDQSDEDQSDKDDVTALWRAHAFFGRNYLVNDSPLTVAIGAPAKYKYLGDNNAFVIDQELQRHIDAGDVGDDIAGYVDAHKDDQVSLPILLLGMQTNEFPFAFSKAETNLWHGVGIPQFANSMLNDDESLANFYNQMKENNETNENILVTPTILSSLGTTMKSDEDENEDNEDASTELIGIPASLHAYSNIIFTILNCLKNNTMDLLKYYWIQGMSTTFYDSCYRQMIPHLNPKRNKLYVKVRAIHLILPFMVAVGDKKLGWPIGGPYTFKDLSDIGLLPIMRTYTWSPCFSPGDEVCQVGIGQYEVKIHGDKDELFRIEVDQETAQQLAKWRDDNNYEALWSSRFDFLNQIQFTPKSEKFGFQTSMVDLTVKEPDPVPITTLPRCGSVMVNYDFSTYDFFDIYALGKYIFYSVNDELYELTLDFATEDTLCFPEHLIYIVYNNLTNETRENPLDLAFGPFVTLEIIED